MQFGMFGIAAAAGAKKAEAAEARNLYSLLSDFDFDSYENRALACRDCNNSKGARRLSDGLVGIRLEKAKSLRHRAIQVVAGIERDRDKGNLLARLATAYSKGDITEKELEQFLSGLPGPAATSHSDYSIADVRTGRARNALDCSRLGGGSRRGSSAIRARSSYWEVRLHFPSIDPS